MKPKATFAPAQSPAIARRARHSCSRASNRMRSSSSSSDRRASGSQGRNTRGLNGESSGLWRLPGWGLLLRYMMPTFLLSGNCENYLTPADTPAHVEMCLIVFACVLDCCGVATTP
jgi:hypothetical protein